MFVVSGCVGMYEDTAAAQGPHHPATATFHLLHATAAALLRALLLRRALSTPHLLLSAAALGTLLLGRAHCAALAAAALLHSGAPLLRALLLGATAAAILRAAAHLLPAASLGTLLSAPAALLL